MNDQNAGVTCSQCGAFHEGVTHKKRCCGDFIDDHELLKESIKRLGGDGLIYLGECVCGIDDLAPCGYVNLYECVIGFAGKTDADDGITLYTTKAEAERSKS